MSTYRLFRKMIIIFYLGSVVVFLGSCAGNKNSIPQNVAGEEYGTNDYGGWR
ncbi:hypothetical protein [Legionella cherrii]|uniref:Uncharacterized protein n=1 Tax=Legionella cherrii TaxID=28084 RepID=A0A0W0SCW8_9GAMM|nr:hypothetical protein [Legionella cherrii]KTC80693.1 hypothetical protein Lche_2713 [Legionella cherrii]VEB34530.1 Uncharacterised protein [Legionella cherrii]